MVTEKIKTKSSQFTNWRELLIYWSQSFIVILINWRNPLKESSWSSRKAMWSLAPWEEYSHATQLFWDWLAGNRLAEKKLRAWWTSWTGISSVSFQQLSHIVVSISRSIGRTSSKVTLHFAECYENISEVLCLFWAEEERWRKLESNEEGQWTGACDVIWTRKGAKGKIQLTIFLNDCYREVKLQSKRQGPINTSCRNENVIRC